MLARFLYTPTGRVRPRRMIIVVGGAVAFAIFGTFLLVLTPVIGQDRASVETVWVLFSVFLLKFPLVSLLWWFIARNKEWPVRPPKWSEEETREIMAYLLSEADRSLALPDAPDRLAYLQREAWNVADRVGGDLKIDAVNVALHIDQLQTHPRPRGTRPR